MLALHFFKQSNNVNQHVLFNPWDRCYYSPACIVRHPLEPKELLFAEEAYNSFRYIVSLCHLFEE